MGYSCDKTNFFHILEQSSNERPLICDKTDFTLLKNWELSNQNALILAPLKVVTINKIEALF